MSCVLYRGTTILIQITSCSCTSMAPTLTCRQNEKNPNTTILKRRITCMQDKFTQSCWVKYVINNNTSAISTDNRKYRQFLFLRLIWYRDSFFMRDMLHFTFFMPLFLILISMISIAMEQITKTKHRILLLRLLLQQLYNLLQSPSNIQNHFVCANQLIKPPFSSYSQKSCVISLVEIMT